MSFKSPWLLLGLLVLALAIGLWVLAERRRARYTVRYTNLDVLATVVSGRSWLRYVPSALVALGLAVLIVGIARPEVKRTLVKERATVILVVDTSRSMQAKDVEPTRLGAAQEALRTFLDQAPHDLRIGLVVFAGEAQVATPPTKDHALVDTAITDIDQFLVYGGTAIGDALQTAVLLGQAGDRSRADGRGRRHGAVDLDVLDALARAGVDVWRREEPGVDPLPLRRRADAWPSAAARGREAREGGVLPRLHGRARNAAGSHRARPVRRLPGEPAGRPGDPGSSRSGHAPRRSRAPPAASSRRRAQRTRSERAYQNLGSRLGREPGQSEITWLFIAIAAALLLLATAIGAFVSPRLP